MPSLGAKFRTWKVMKGKYTSDIHQSNLIHGGIVKRGKKDFVLLICELLIFFTHPFSFWNQQFGMFILGGLSSLKGHSWLLQYLFILKITADLIQVPVEAVCTITSSVLWTSPFGQCALCISPFQHTPGFSSRVDLCCSRDAGVLEVHGIQVAFCMFQMSSAHQYRAPSPPPVCWALFKRDQIIWPPTGAQKLPNSAEGTQHLTAWSLQVAIICECARNQIQLKRTRIGLNLMWTCCIWYGLLTSHVNPAQWFQVNLKRKGQMKMFLLQWWSICIRVLADTEQPSEITQNKNISSLTHFQAFCEESTHL